MPARSSVAPSPRWTLRRPSACPACGPPSGQTLTNEVAQADFILYGTLSNAKPDPKDTWSVKAGVLVCTGKPNGCVVTKNAYSDYTLKLKWRFPADGTGGNNAVAVASFTSIAGGGTGFDASEIVVIA